MSLASILVGPVFDILDKIIPDKDAARRAAEQIAATAQDHAHAERIAQMEVNKAEAQHASIFVAGWRPFIGWSLGFAMTFNYIAAPLINWATALAGKPIVLPVLDFQIMLPVLLGMLGLATNRTVERIKGKARNTIRPKGD
jgi:hypothetical protein